MRRFSIAALIVVPLLTGPVLAQRVPQPAPVIAVETSKGTFVFETFPQEAPVTVAHVDALVRRKFYDGQRVHRAIPGFVVQFGDPRSRDLTAQAKWGRGPEAGSGQPVGEVELDRKRLHRKGSVSLAHMGDPAKAESQIFVTLADRPDLDGRYVVFGQVTSGQDVLEALAIGDEILRVYVRE